MTSTEFRKFFGDSPNMRVFDFFLDRKYFDYSMADVIRDENISYNTLKPIWEELMARKIIIPTRKLGKGEMYRLNTDSSIVQQLIMLDHTLIEHSEREVLE